MHFCDDGLSKIMKIYILKFTSTDNPIIFWLAQEQADLYRNTELNMKEVDERHWIKKTLESNENSCPYKYMDNLQCI